MGRKPERGTQSPHSQLWRITAAAAPILRLQLLQGHPSEQVARTSLRTRSVPSQGSSCRAGDRIHRGLEE